MTAVPLRDAADAEALRDLERAANLVALAHVFPPEEFPFPTRRWRTGGGRRSPTRRCASTWWTDRAVSRVFAAYDATTLRHLAVHPDDWGTGLGPRGGRPRDGRDRRRW